MVSNPIERDHVAFTWLGETFVLRAPSCRSGAISYMDATDSRSSRHKMVTPRLYKAPMGKSFKFKSSDAAEKAMLELMEKHPGASERSLLALLENAARKRPEVLRSVVGHPARSPNDPRRLAHVRRHEDRHCRVYPRCSGVTGRTRSGTQG